MFLELTVLFPDSIPSPEVLEQAMRDDLAGSLAYLHASSVDLQAIEPSALAKALSEIRSHRVLPGLFGRYFDLVLELTQGDCPKAVGLFNEILDLSPKLPDERVVRYRPEGLGEDFERYARLIDLGSDSPGFLADPTDPEWQNLRDQMPTALDLVEQAAPGLQTVRCTARLTPNGDRLLTQAERAVA